MGVKIRVATRALATAVAVFIGAGLALPVSPVAADILPVPAPLQQRDEDAVTADVLPTVQIDSGVVWSQVVIGDTVYAGGSFSQTRPAGAEPGTNLTPRGNLLAYDIRTGELVTSFAPNLNGQVKVVAASPDGSRLYVGGAFTQADGQPRWNIAAYSTVTGQLLTTFRPAVGGTSVNAIVATNTTVYVGGLITAGAGVPRTNLMAFSASNGALLNWAPTTDRQVDAMVMDPTGTKLIVGGRFGVVNGTAQRGMGALDLTTGALLPWAAPQTVVNGMSTGSYAGKAGIFTLTADATAVYGTGWSFAPHTVGNLEGAFAAEAGTGAIRWVQDCHGDHYGIFSTGKYVYTTSHAHACETVNGFPQANPAPGNLRHSTVFTAEAKGTLSKTPNLSTSYLDWSGKPAPAMLNWFPDWVTGTGSGQGQAAWTVTGNADYVVVGGEFPFVNTRRQQGLVRFAVPRIAPKAERPRVTGAAWVAAAQSFGPGKVRISIPANWDRDDLTLTYRLLRNNGTTAVAETTVSNSFWNRGTVVLTDSVDPGTTHTYTVTATDPDGNVATSAPLEAQAGNQETGVYASAVLADGPSTYWRLGENTGTATAFDWAGSWDGVTSAGVTRGTAGAVPGDNASSFSGSSTGLVRTQVAQPAPTVFSAEAWIKTTTTRGGKILGFGNLATGSSGTDDRHVYMSNNGRLFFGVQPGGTMQTVSTATGYNDGKWHHVVATLGPDGMNLYVDGIRQASHSVTTALAYSGYWRVGGDSVSGWPTAPTSLYFEGAIDEVAIYPTVLTRAQVVSHYRAGNYTFDEPALPTDAYGAAVRAGDPDLYWRLNDPAGSRSAADTGGQQRPGVVPASGVQFNVAGPGGLPGTAATFSGSQASVVATKATSNPKVFSQSAWFRTTTTRGGKIIGLGSSSTPTGTSSNTDRHVYMQNDGRLVFGVNPSAKVTLTTPTPYNDGQWHFVTATQGAEGMRLYVDGQLLGSNTTTGAENFIGYWRIGGDATWGSTSPWFAGSIDEAAVYSRVLGAAEIDDLYQLGIGGAPTAAFVSQTTDLTTQVNGSTSVAAAGRTIVSYHWDFKDGSPEVSGATAVHTYMEAGTFDVTLTVTDNRGVRSSHTVPITVTAPHVPPTAAFTHTADSMSIAFSSASSTVTDNATVATHAWDFGDGTTSSEANPTHRFSTVGSHQVTLVVTDSLGFASTASSASIEVTHEAPIAAFTEEHEFLTVAVDASATTASDDASLSYAWHWGDGTQDSEGVTAEHTFAAVGTYPVTLTVTDSLGGAHSVTREVVVSAHAAPVPSFVVTKDGLAVTVDASASTASDGATLAYSWEWSDSSEPGDGATATHEYAADGTYAVTLTLTDSFGSSAALTQDVVMRAPIVNALAVERFERTTTNGWGTADVGGTWSGTAGFSTAAGVGSVSVVKSQTRSTALSGVSAADVDATVSFSMDKIADGGGSHFNLLVRKTASGEYRAKVRISATGAVQLSIAKLVGTTETLVANRVLTGVTYVAGTTMKVRLQATGSGTSAIKAKTWIGLDAEPADWTLQLNDSTPELQGPGTVGLSMYLTGTVTNGPVVWAADNLLAVIPAP